MKREALWPWIDPDRLRRDLQEGDGADLACRRGIILLSMASMAAVSLLQTGICVMGALANVAIAALAVAEARRAWSALAR